MRMIRSWVLVFLTILCLGTISTQSTIAQDPNASDDITPIPHGDVLDILFNFNGQADVKCVLPCLYEIRPEQTTLSEIQTIFTTLFEGDKKILAQFDRPVELNEEQRGYSLINIGPEGSFTLGFIVSLKNEILQRFHTRLLHPGEWLGSSNVNLSTVLATLGQPDEVYLSIVASEPPQFGIVLTYKTLGTVFSYVYPIEPKHLTQNDEPIVLCGRWSKTYSVDVWIQAVDDNAYETLLDENFRVEQKPGTDGIVYRAYWPLERMTKWNTKDITRFLIDNSEWCFDAYSYNELLKSGYSY